MATKLVQFYQQFKQILFWTIFHFSEINKYRTSTLHETQFFLSSHDCKYVANLIYGSVARELDDYNNVKATIKDAKISCVNLALILITNVAFDKLTTGRYHLYRGLLTPPGKELYNFFCYANEKLVENGYQLEEAFKADKTILKKEISKMG